MNKKSTIRGETDGHTLSVAIDGDLNSLLNLVVYLTADIFAEVSQVGEPSGSALFLEKIKTAVEDPQGLMAEMGAPYDE